MASFIKACVLATVKYFLLAVPISLGGGNMFSFKEKKNKPFHWFVYVYFTTGVFVCWPVVSRLANCKVWRLHNAGRHQGAAVAKRASSFQAVATQDGGLGGVTDTYPSMPYVSWDP